MAKEIVVQILEEIGTLLELKDENPFKIRAYHNAARVLEGQPEDLKTLIETGKLEELKGIGSGISETVHELFQKGKSKYHEELRKSFPEGLFEILQIQGLGPKRVKILYKQLGIKSVGELEYACKENRLLDLEGFGAKTQENILQGIEHHKKSSGQFLIATAKKEANAFVDYLKKKKGIERIEVAGSIRRHKEIVKDIDILVTAKDSKKVHDAFVKYPQVETAIAHGDTKSSVTLKSGMNCDLRTVSEKEFPFALYYFTGSKEHNVEMRTIAKKAGFKINEYGLFKGNRLIPCKDEEEIFKKLGFHYIPPELREGEGELESARKGELPELVKEKDIRGVFHVHSTYSDGVASLEEMIAAAQDLGFEYVGISDHSQSAKYARGLEPARLKEQRKEIDKLAKKYSKIRIFWGTESDILATGKLDYPDSILEEFDFVIGSIHSQFNLSEKEQTNRVLRAMDSKFLTFVGHPTGRLLLGREGYSIDLTKIIEGAKEKIVSIELNANPHRLDLDWRYCPYAKKKGVRLSINPDAHSVEGLRDVTYGVGIARKGWLEKKDVVNTMPLAEMEKFLKRRR
ncbi:MAG: DNA polymerase/3'-5' exonuclease PolX [Candidatus Omnitrophica bacterium]|nr:DNA polymerase/3'-5' exonuclease PolX [Candidatus Omnitrophota bacterium]